MENIIETMTGQRRILQKDLGGALDLTKSENPNKTMKLSNELWVLRA